jgi:hypothetical protein
MRFIAKDWDNKIPLNGILFLKPVKIVWVRRNGLKRARNCLVKTEKRKRVAVGR